MIKRYISLSTFTASMQWPFCRDPNSTRPIVMILVRKISLVMYSCNRSSWGFDNHLRPGEGVGIFRRSPSPRPRPDPECGRILDNPDFGRLSGGAAFLGDLTLVRAAGGLGVVGVAVSLADTTDDSEDVRSMGLLSAVGDSPLSVVSALAVFVFCGLPEAAAFVFEALPSETSLASSVVGLFCLLAHAAGISTDRSLSKS